MQLSRILVQLSLILGFALTRPVTAGTILSNLPSAEGGTDTDICNTASSFCFGSVSAAVGFLMPTGNDFLLDSVALSLQEPSSPSMRIQSLTVRLFSDVGGQAGVPLLTFITPTFPDTLTIFTASFSIPSPFYLQAGHGYWIVLQDDDPVSTPTIILWRGNYPATIPTGIASFLGFSYDFNLTPPVTQRGGPPNFPQGFAVNATAVPEPSSFLHMTSGCLLAILFTTIKGRRKLSV